MNVPVSRQSILLLRIFPLHHSSIIHSSSNRCSSEYSTERFLPFYPTPIDFPTTTFGFQLQASISPLWLRPTILWAFHSAPLSINRLWCLSLEFYDHISSLDRFLPSVSLHSFNATSTNCGNDVWFNHLSLSRSIHHITSDPIPFLGYVDVIQADAVDFDSQQIINIVVFRRHSKWLLSISHLQSIYTSSICPYPSLIVLLIEPSSPVQSIRLIPNHLI